LLLLALAGCQRRIDNMESVRQAVLDYLSSRTNLNISSMSVNVASVVFRDNEADAVVTFAAKGSNPGQGMEMRYTLEKKGGRWVVKNRADSGKNPHGSGMASPHGGDRGNPGEPVAMPPGHPAVPGSAEKNPKTK
jgi:hypothetical protein